MFQVVRRALARPQLLLRVLAAAFVAGALAGVLMILATPVASVTATMAANGTIELAGRGQRLRVPGDSPVAFRAANGEIARTTANLLPDIAEPRGDAAANAAYWAARDAVAAMLRSGPVAVIAADGRTLTATARPRTLADLTFGFWLSMIAGVVAGLAGVWVWVLRLREWGPVLFAASGAALFVGLVTTAMNAAGGLALTGAIDHAMLVWNYASGVVCAGGLAALFARFPKPLVAARWLWVVVVSGVFVVASTTFALVPGAVDIAIAIIGLYALAILVFLALQVWASRGDRAARAAILPIAIGGGVSVALYTGLTMLWQFAGGTPLIAGELTAPSLVLVYLGLGLSVVRARLFALGRQALGLLVSASAAVLLLVSDSVVLATVGQQRNAGLAAAAVAGAVVYIAAREMLLRRLRRQKDNQTLAMLRLAADVALAPSAAASAQAFRAAAQALFEPLDLDPGRADALRIGDGASTLALPSPLGGEGLTLKYPGGGARLFGPADLALASRFADLVRRLAEARDAYVRGAAQERERIARDLHDDVNARLLTGLSRNSAEAMQADIRAALADIDAIVRSLTGKPRALAELLSDMEREAAERLAAAGVALTWTAAPSERRLEAAAARNTASIIREAVSNLIRHSGATAATVTAAVDGDRLTLTLADNGRGADVGSEGEGHGLANARARAEAMGGTIEIASLGGTTLTLTAPLIAL